MRTSDTQAVRADEEQICASGVGEERLLALGPTALEEANLLLAPVAELEDHGAKQPKPEGTDEEIEVG